MANRYFSGPIQTLETEIKQIFGKLTIGASGAITAQDGKGMTIVKTATETGRYTITMGRSGVDDTYYEFKHLQAIVEALADTALTGTEGYIPVLRNVDVTNGFTTVDLQMVDFAGADKNPLDGAVIYIAITVKNSSVDF